MTDFSCNGCRYFGTEHPDYPGVHLCYLPGHGALDFRMDTQPHCACHKWEAKIEPKEDPGGFGCEPCRFFYMSEKYDSHGRRLWC